MTDNVVLEIDLDDAPIRFKDLGEISAFVSNERGFWSSLETPAKEHLSGHAHRWVSAQIKFVENLQRLVATANNAGTHNATEISALKQAIEKAKTRQKNRMLCSRVAADGFIKTFLLIDPEAAVAAIILRSGPDAMKEALSVVGRDVIASLRDAQIRYQIAYAEALGETHRKKLEETLTQIEAERRTDAAASKLAQHWSDRSNIATKQALGCLAILAVAAVAILYFGFRIGSQIFAAAEASKDILTYLSKEAAPMALSFAPFAVLVAIPVIWLFRHLSRLFIENLADSRDASLRATMAEAYIALNNNQLLKPTKEERAVILSALFRAGASQPADEGVPLPLIELLKK